MVDKCTDTKDVLEQLEEDNEFFKRMLSLLPPLVIPEQATEQHEKAADKRKQRQKEKKLEKRMKKKEMKAAEKQTSSLEPQNGSDVHLSAVKQKKAKIEEGNLEEEDEGDSLEKMDDDENSDTDSAAEKLLLREVPELTTTKIPQKISAKHKHAQSTVKTSVKKKHGKEKKSLNCSVNNHEKPKDAVLPNVSLKTDSLLTESISSIEDKRAKLREKIEQLKAKRNPTNQERLNRKKLKRQESKMKLKQKRKLEKLQGKQNQANGEKSKSTLKDATPVKPVFNKEGQVVYSKFDFTDSAKKEKPHTDLHGKDYKRLLEKIEKRNMKINKLKNKDESAGKVLEDKLKWESVLHKAQGEKVKDNPELLKKALKRKQKIKDQKKKKWEKRMEHVEKMKDDRQKKRNENIQNRKQAVKDKKIQKLKKKGRIIPGF